MQQYAPWVAAMSQALAAGDTEGFEAALSGFDCARNRDLALRVRLVASDLQGALERFRLDARLPDARHRLAHVLKLTDDAAHRTMDLVEQCCPLAQQIAEQAERLLSLQQATESAETPQGQLAAFLKQVGTGMAVVRSNLSEVLLAQGYQDLSGQIIRGVMALVDELEQALADLLRIAGADSPGGSDNSGGGRGDASSGSTGRGYGPPVPGINRGPAVCGQADVDTLLSDLGM